MKRALLSILGVASVVLVGLSGEAQTVALPERKDFKLQSPVGVGKFAHIGNLSSEAVAIDIGCALRNSRRESVPPGTTLGPLDQRSSYLISDGAGKLVNGYRIHSLNTGGPDMLAFQSGVNTQTYITFFQHLTGIEVIATAPLTYTGADVGRNLVDDGFMFFRPDGSSSVDEADFTNSMPAMLNASENVDPSCIQVLGASTASPFVAYVAFRYKPGYTPDTSRETQLRTWSAYLGARIKATQIDNAISSGAPPQRVAALARSLLAGMDIAFQGDSDAAQTIENLRSLETSAENLANYNTAYSRLVDAKTASSPQVAHAAADAADRTLIQLGNFLNSADLERAARMISTRAQGQINTASEAQQRTAQHAQALESQREQDDAQRAAATARAAQRQRQARLQAAAARYSPEQQALILKKYDRMPDRIGTGSLNGQTYVTWTWAQRTYYFDNQGVIIRTVDLY